MRLDIGIDFFHSLPTVGICFLTASIVPVVVVRISPVVARVPISIVVVVVEVIRFSCTIGSHFYRDYNKAGRIFVK
jgi:hypothetical protein